MDPAPDLTQLITTQLDLLPTATQREIILYLARRYHADINSPYPYPYGPYSHHPRHDMPPRIPAPAHPTR